MELYSNKMNKMLMMAFVGIMSIFVGACRRSMYV